MPLLARFKLYSVWTPLLFFLFLRLATAPFFGLGVDEAHYLLYAKYLALSYYDHPPLVGWLHAPLFYTFGANEFTARVPAILLGCGSTYLAYRLIFGFTNNQRIAFWSVVGLNSSFIFGALFLMLLPDTILVFLLFLLIFLFLRLVKNQTLGGYLLFGLILGLCGMAKYTAIIFVFGILAYVMSQKQYKLIFSKFTPVAIIMALVAILPVLIWNIENNFASFAYQGSHVAGGKGFSIGILGKNIATQFVAYSPPLFVIAVYGFVKLFRYEESVVKLSAWLGLAIVLFFMVTSSTKSALPHWISPFFAIFIPFGIAYLFLISRSKVAIYSILFSFILTVLIHIELVFKFGTFADFKSPFRDIYGWQDGVKTAKELRPNNTKLAVLNWSEGSRVWFYADEPIYVADSRRDQFDIWFGEEFLSKDYLFLQPKSSRQKVESKCKCEETTNLGMFDARLNGGVVEGFDFILCKNFQGLK